MGVDRQTGVCRHVSGKETMMMVVVVVVVVVGWRELEPVACHKPAAATAVALPRSQRLLAHRAKISSAPSTDNFLVRARACVRACVSVCVCVLV